MLWKMDWREFGPGSRVNQIKPRGTFGLLAFAGLFRAEEDNGHDDMN